MSVGTTVSRGGPLVLAVVLAAVGSAPPPAMAVPAAGMWLPAPKKMRFERVKVTVSPGKGTFGVGQLITVRFSHPVRYRAQAEAAMTVTSPDRALPTGAWRWIDSTTAVYRPREFWPAHTRIAVRLDLRRQVLDADRRTQWIGGPSATRVVRFRTGDRFVAQINARTTQMRVFVDGRLVKVFGVSLGKPGFRTRSGVKIITGEKYRVTRMTSQQLGLTDEFYDLQVPYAVRITPTGEFIHGAPWAAGRIGRWNGSHGCTNLNVGPAKWFFNHVRPGDVTITRNTGRRMEPWNGVPGSYWNYSWRQWRAKSALSGQ